MHEEVKEAVPVNYQTPALSGPFCVYERPMLLDIEEAASCDWGCVTSGNGGGGGS